MKRVYKLVAVAEAPEGGFAVTLDGRTLRSPARNVLALPTRSLADGVAAEWDAQSDEIRPQTMPLMQLASTAVDRVRVERAAIVAGTAAYAGTDLLCYRADEPQELVDRQRRSWQPLLDWAALRYDAALVVQSGLMPVSQPAAALKAFLAAVEAYDDWRLSALQAATSASGSLVVALALMEGRLDADSAFEVAELDESWSIEKWGEDTLATERRANLRADVHAARRFHDLLMAA